MLIPILAIIAFVCVLIGGKGRDLRLDFAYIGLLILSIIHLIAAIVSL